MADIVEFTLGEKNYGIEVDRSESVVEKDKDELTNLFRTPDVIEGITIFRGDPIPVVDLSEIFDIEIDEIRKGKRDNKYNILVFNTTRGNMGIIVDEVLEVSSIDKIENIENKNEFMEGITEKEDSIISFIDIDKIIEKIKILVQEENKIQNTEKTH